jgi:hypothetical protein
MGWASIDWKCFPHHDGTGEAEDKGGVFEKVDGNAVNIFSGEISSRHNFLGPFQCPPKPKGRRKATGAAKACITKRFVIMFTHNEMCDGGFPSICYWVGENAHNESNFLPYGQHVHHGSTGVINYLCHLLAKKLVF